MMIFILFIALLIVTIVQLHYYREYSEKEVIKLFFSDKELIYHLLYALIVFLIPGLLQFIKYIKLIYLYLYLLLLNIFLFAINYHYGAY